MLSSRTKLPRGPNWENVVALLSKPLHMRAAILLPRFNLVPRARRLAEIYTIIRWLVVARDRLGSNMAPEKSGSEDREDVFVWTPPPPDETPKQKFWRKTKENPFVPLCK